jgi:hypothetical protein
MRVSAPNDSTIDDLLELAGISPTDIEARRWLRHALIGAKSTAAGQPKPNPARHNAPLAAIERAAAKLTETMHALRHHPHAYLDFWSYADFGPVFGDKHERPHVISNVKSILTAAQKGRISKSGRPADRRKQHIINLALGFWVRFSPVGPSSDESNPFVSFAERFFENATGLSVDGRGNGIMRQIRAALQRMPIEIQRAARRNETPHQN